MAFCPLHGVLPGPSLSKRCWKTHGCLSSTSAPNNTSTFMFPAYTARLAIGPTIKVGQIQFRLGQVRFTLEYHLLHHLIDIGFLLGSCYINTCQYRLIELDHANLSSSSKSCPNCIGLGTSILFLDFNLF